MGAFISQWDVFEKDGTISFDDFREYYHDLGSLIPDDVYFEWMLRSAWKLGSDLTSRRTGRATRDTTCRRRGDAQCQSGAPVRPSKPWAGARTVESQTA